MNAKTLPPPALDPRAPLPLDEVAQTYARDAARRVTTPAPPRDQVELEVDAMFTAEAIVSEPRRPSTVLSRAVARINARQLRPVQQQALDEIEACPGGFFTIGVPK
jgi:hypothetical protein